MSIVLSNLTKRFGDNLVVNNVSLEVEDGELFVLLGGSGSGKSTILRLIAGLIEPDSGRVLLRERDVTHLPPQARGTGFVFQNYSIFRHMTVAENVEFGLRIRRAPPEQRRRRREELLDLVGLAGLGERYADQLSGGQQQRVALARALAYEPAVLLLDEPFGALDVKIRAQMRESLKEIQRRLRVTAILVTHDQEEAFELADRVGVLDRGLLVEVGTPEGLYHQPRTEFVASFVGGGNVLVGREDGGQVRLGSALLPLPAGAPAHEGGAPVRVLFRPESVRVQSAPFDLEAGVTPLGQGRVLSGGRFGGALDRLLVEVEGLQGARPVSPPPPFGHVLARIEVALPSRLGAPGRPAAGQEVWLGLSDYHVLEPTGLKVLVWTGPDEAGQAAAEVGLRLAQAAGGPATLLDVSPEGGEARLEALRRAWQDRVPRLETRLRPTEGAEGALREAQAGLHEVVVLGARADPLAPGSPARRLLLQVGAAVLLVPSARPAIARVLICTAGGEPGKSDIRLGGRIARRAGARATVFHVQRPDLGPLRQERLARHMRQAQAYLAGLGVESETLVDDGAPVPRIVQQAEAGDYDLIVIGAPHAGVPDLAARLAAPAPRPLLVVPMGE